MRDLTIRKLHEVTGGRLRLATLPPRDGEGGAIGRIVADSRLVQPGDTFWALRGPHFDGSEFAAEAYRRGAAGVVVQERYVQPNPGCFSLQVSDTATALRQLAAWNRNRFTGTIVAITGSVGKTTARHMIHSVLSTRRTGSTSPKNFNNHVGVPLSMLGMEPDDHFAVLELAANRSGEIGELAALCRPQIGVITRIGDAHLGGFGNARAIAHAKAELLAELPEDGWAALSGDDPWLRRLARRSRANVVWFGRSLDCDFVATDVHSGQGQLRFRVEGQPLAAPIWGRHHLTSALAAVAVGKLFGLAWADIARGLADFQPPPMRCQVGPLGDATLIDDTYNASPAAMRAALELLRDFDAPGRRIVVCGDMRELGDAAAPLHRQLGDEVVTVCGADLLVACGEHATDVAAGARDAGMPRKNILTFRAPEETVPHVRRALSAGDVVLVKGSRGLAMERVVEALRPQPLRRAA